MIRLILLILLLPLVLLSGACDRPGGGNGAAAADSTLLDRLTATPGGATVHLVRIVSEGDAPAFRPATVTIREGDVVRFVLGSGRPESITFDPSGLPPELADWVEQNGLRSGSLLTASGQTYDVAFDDAPLGEYLFQPRTAGDRAIAGRVVVTP